MRLTKLIDPTDSADSPASAAPNRAGAARRVTLWDEIPPAAPRPLPADAAHSAHSNVTSLPPA